VLLKHEQSKESVMDVILREIRELGESIRKAAASGERIAAVDMKDAKGRCPFTEGETYPLSVFVPVMTGCNNYCSYCRITLYAGVTKKDR
jgi:tRNA A37 methylthiotransferase MiaB